MDNLVRMQVLQGLADLVRNRSSHVDRKRREVATLYELLEVATSHVFHHDEMVILAGELFLEAHNVRTVSATILQLNFSCNLLSVFLALDFGFDFLQSKGFVC